MENISILDKFRTYATKKDKQYQTRTPTESELHDLRVYPLRWYKLKSF